MLSNTFLGSASNISQNWSKFVFQFNHVIKLANEGQILTNPGRLTFWGSENPLPISVFTYYSFQTKLSSFWEVSQPKFHKGTNDDKWATKLRKRTRKKDRNKFADKGRSFGSSAWKVLKKKKTSQNYLHPKNISQFSFISMLICGKPVQLIKFCMASVGVKLSLP